MDPDAAAAITAQLDSDESLLWADSPDTILEFFYPLLASFFFAGRLYYSRFPGPTSFHIWIAGSISVFLLSWLLSRHTFYGMSNRRAITVLAFFGRTWTTRSASLVNLNDVPIVIRRGYLWKVIFGRSGKNRGISPYDPNVGLVFRSLANADAVCEQARAVQQSMLAEIDARTKARGSARIPP
jgi:hypothetical protein